MAEVPSSIELLSVCLVTPLYLPFTSGHIPEVVCMKVSGHKTRNVFDRYNITSERDLADAAKKIELSYRQAKVAETEQETHQTETATIQ